MNPNDIINQALMGLQTSNENMALKLQNEKLKEELERLRASSFVTAVTVEVYEKLKADVERLTNNCDYLDQKLDEEIDKSAMLCGQVERLTKAGDAILHTLLWTDEYSVDRYKDAEKKWKTAKEGKQS